MPSKDVPEAGYLDYGAEDNEFLWLGRLLWIGILLSGLSALVLALWGVGITVVALDRGEAWAEWLTAGVFVAAFLLVFRELR